MDRPARIQRAQRFRALHDRSQGLLFGQCLGRRQLAGFRQPWLRRHRHHQRRRGVVAGLRRGRAGGHQCSQGDLMCALIFGQSVVTPASWSSPKRHCAGHMLTWRLVPIASTRSSSPSQRRSRSCARRSRGRSISVLASLPDLAELGRLGVTRVSTATALVTAALSAAHRSRTECAQYFQLREWAGREIIRA